MWRKIVEPQDLNGLQLPNYIIKQNLLIKICQHVLIIRIVLDKYI